MIAQFALRLICGMSLMWCLMPRREVTSGFFRIQMLVVLGLSVVVVMLLEPPDASAQSEPWIPYAVSFWGTLALGCCAFLGSVFWALERRTGGVRIAFLVATLSTPLLLGCVAPTQTPDGLSLSLLLASELTSAGLLGSAMTSMLLGHWYLTAPTMSIQPLHRLTWILGAAAAARLLVSALALAIERPELGGMTEALWLVLRWVTGILGPLILFFVVLRILKYRNTQSATGVLYVCVILTFIGEMTGAMLFRELAVPL